jgi:hypothetical protein
MKSAVVPWEFWSAAIGGIVLPSRCLIGLEPDAGDADHSGDADVIIKLVPTPRTMSDGLQILRYLLR